jgi:hypothetical protein
MGVEKFRGYVAAVVAAVLSIGSLVGLVFVWMQPVDETAPRELALIFGALTGAFSSASTYLFMQEAASRATHATERALGDASFRESVRTSSPLEASISYGEPERTASYSATPPGEDPFDVPADEGADADERGSDVLTQPPPERP